MAYIGEIKIFGGLFEPKGWAFCAGQLIPLQQNTTLFSLLGTTYGGDGKTTFALPNLCGRVPLHVGAFLSNPPYTLGQTLGTEREVLSANQLPPHIHRITGNVYQPVLGENPGQLSSPDNNYMAITNGQQVYSTTKHATNRMGPLKVTMQVQNAGNGQSIDNMQPYLPLNFIICLSGGQFPSRP